MIKKLLFLSSGLLLFLFPTMASAGCAVFSENKLSAIKEPLAQLLQIEDNDAQYGYVHPNAIKQIDQLKSALIALINQRVACQNNLSIDANQVQQDLLGALKLSELSETKAIYGYNLQIAVDRPKNLPDIMVVQASFGIPCGDDNILLIYRFRNNSWHLDLAWKSQPYKIITGAYSHYFDYLILSSLNNDTPRILVFHSSADCTASWKPLIFDVIKLADDMNQQSVLLHQQLFSFKENGVVSTKKLADGFEFQANVAMLDPDLGARRAFFRYHIVNDKVIREQPLAITPRDFVDEWLTLNKSDTIRFSFKDNAKDLLQEQAEFKDRGGFYGATKYCKKEELYEVEITFNGTKEIDAETVHYFYVKPIKNGYLMHSSAEHSNKNCYERVL